MSEFENKTPDSKLTKRLEFQKLSSKHLNLVELLAKAPEDEPLEGDSGIKLNFEGMSVNGHYRILIEDPVDGKFRNLYDFLVSKKGEVLFSATLETKFPRAENPSPKKEILELALDSLSEKLLSFGSN